MTCELRQITPAYAQKLLADPDQVLHYVDKADTGRLPKEAQGEDLNLGKAWHGLHFLLTGTAWQGTEPACYLLAGGAQVGDEEEHNVYGYGPARILTPAQVADFSAAVNALTSDGVRRRFDAALMTKLDIYPEGWDREGEDAQNFEFLAEAARNLRAFLSRAARQELAVIIYFA